MSDTEYNDYLKAEWELFAGDPARARAALAAAYGVKVSRVLDMDCGAGQDARFYLRKLMKALTSLHALSAIHAVRVLAAGSIYHLSGKQPRNSLVGNESFHTLWLLRRGLKIVGEMPDSNPARPSFIISSGRVLQA